MNFSPVLYHVVLNTLLIAVGGIGLFYLLFFIIRQWTKSKRNFIPQIFDKHIHLSGLLLFIAVILNIALQNFKPFLNSGLYGNLSHAVAIALIMAAGFFVIKVVAFLKDLLLKYYEHRPHEEYAFRSTKTKLLLIQRIVSFVITFIIIAAMLMTFPQVRQIGSTLLASAGVAGVVIGFAAQKSLGTLFAGIQIALTQPIKIDDIVVIDKYFGTIGEITLTYVVLKTRDEKRLIVPINYFLENNIENWTRSSAAVIASVKIRIDYSIPIEELRNEFNQWLQETPLWDKRSSGLLITDADDKTIEVQATMSAKNANDSFQLECYAREKMINYIREHHAEALLTAEVNNKDQMIPEENNHR